MVIDGKSHQRNSRQMKLDYEHDQERFGKD